MKDVYAVLSQKEEDVLRVRKEVQALITVIPLLADQEQTADDFYQILLSSTPATVADGNGMADLERYYPFVRHLQKR